MKLPLAIIRTVSSLSLVRHFGRVVKVPSGPCLTAPDRDGRRQAGLMGFGGSASLCGTLPLF